MASREVPASIGQRLLWVLDRYRGDDGALNCPVLCRLRGPLDTVALGAAIHDLTRRHEALRTTFARRGRSLYQLIHDPQPPPFQSIDVSGAGAEVALSRAITAELQTRIDATEWPVRVTLWRLRDRDHALCVNMHHLVSDAWSGGIVVRDLRLLCDRAAGGAIPLPEVGWQYTQFAEWQQRSLAGDASRAHRDYWRQKLLGAELPALPLRAGPGAGAEQRTAREIADIAPAVVESLRRASRAQRTTLFNMMLSVYYTLLHRLTGQTDLTVASLFANRSRAELQSTVGFLANPVLLRTRLRAGATFAEVVREVHATAMEAFVHQALPYHMLPADTIPASPQRADDVVFQMMPEPMNRTRMAGAAVEMIVPEGIGSRFELELCLVQRDGGMRVVLFYNRHRLDRGWAAEFVAEYAALAAAARPDRRLADLAR